MENKVAWITGAGSGIGKASAIKLASEGFSVVLSGRTKETLDMVASKCKGQVLVKALDVSNYKNVKAVFEDIISYYGRVDVLVASAGLNAKSRNWHNVSEEDFDQIIKIDLNGVFYTNRLVLKKMKEQRGGVIINVSSWAGKYVTTLTGPAYTAAKHGVNALTEGINMEAGHFGVRACALCPGEVATPILDKRPIPVSKEDKEKMVQPEDCAEIVAFLAKLPPRVCINEITISPTWNRLYVAGLTDQIPKN